MGQITIKWDQPNKADAIIKTEIRRIDNPGTTVMWGNGLKLGETTDTQFITTNFPYDTEFAIMVSHYDGRKWSPISEYWTGTIKQPDQEMDVSDSIDLSDLNTYGGAKTGWTYSATAGTLTTEQTDTWADLGAWNTLTNYYWNGSGAVSGNKNKYTYETSKIDTGFVTELELRPVLDFSSTKTMTWKQMRFPWSFQAYPDKEDLEDKTARIQNYMLSDKALDDGPPLQYVNLNGDTNLGVPLTMQIKYSDDDITYTDWLELPVGKALRLRYFYLRFIWTPYYPRWNFTFNSITLKTYRRNKKYEFGAQSNSGVYDFKDNNGNIVKFFIKPTIILTETDNHAAWISNFFQDANGLYTGVEITCSGGTHDIQLGAIGV